jgi:hypothetical protein
VTEKPRRPPASVPITDRVADRPWLDYFAAIDRYLDTVSGGGGGPDLSAEVAALEAAVDALDAAMVTLQAEIDAAEAVNATQAGQITTLQTDLDAAEAVNATQAGQITTLQTDLDAAEAVNATQAGLITTLQTDLDTAEAAIVTQAGQITALQGPSLLGECRLVYVSATQIRLDRYGGKRLWIDGAWRDIPAAGVTVGHTGLAVTTVYYVYAFMSGGTMTLECVTTAPATDTNYGHRIKTGDATRTLVGMVRTLSPLAFADTAANRLVISWFNRARRALRGNGTSAVTSTSTTTVSLGTAYQVLFLAWADEAADLFVSGYASNNTAAAIVRAFVILDGSGAGQRSDAASAIANALCALISEASQAMTEGLHTLAVGASVSAGTGTFTLTAQGGVG